MDREAFSFAVAMQNLVWGLAQPFTGMVADRLGSGKVIFVGALGYALGLVLMAHSATPADFTLGDGAVIGIALSGTAFGAVYGALSRIFAAQHRSWALGVAGAIGGLGQFVMVPMAQQMLGRMQWTSSLLILAVVMLAVSPFGAWLRDDFAGHLPAYLIDKGMGPSDCGIALALIALANVIGTYMCGHLGGILRGKYVLSVLYYFRSGIMALFVMLPLSSVGLYLFSFAMGLVWLGTVPLTTGVVSQVFGVQYITTLFGIVFFGHQIGAFFGVWLGGYVFDVTKSYDLIWIGSIALGLFAGIVHLPINDREIGSVRPAAVAEAA